MNRKIKLYSAIFFVASLLICFTSCGPKESLPTVTTLPATSITSNSAIVGGNITFAGEPAYTEKGICFSTSQNPALSDNKVAISGTGTGEYTTEITELSENTTYYVRAYSTNSQGTAYGNQISFITMDNPFEFEPEMVSVEGGTFIMGCTGEQGDECYEQEYPAHQVTLSSYRIGKYPITQFQWTAVMGSNPSYFSNCDDSPVEQVSWEDIVGTSGNSMKINGIEYFEDGFIYKLNQLTGKQYRLPTEAEWEYAARGGNQSKGYKYSGSNNVEEVAWFEENSGGTTHPVGTKAANELDIYDMSGNVCEWCGDWYGIYSSDPVINPTGDENGTIRVIRSGFWYGEARWCRVSDRGGNWIGYRDYALGFRLVLPLNN